MPSLQNSPRMSATHPGFSGKVRMYDVLVLPHPPTNTTVHLPLDVVISSVHKMMRRALSAELAYLVRSFFAAMQASYGDTPTQAMLAASTKVVNRFAIALIEEGILVNMRNTPDEFSIVLDCVCDMNAAKEAAVAILERECAKAESLGVDCETLHVSDRRPAEGLLEAAEKEGCDLIVMASHGRRGLQSR